MRNVWGQESHVAALYPTWMENSLRQLQHLVIAAYTSQIMPKVNSAHQDLFRHGTITAVTRFIREMETLGAVIAQDLRMDLRRVLL